jgi:hypothetical protein
MISLYSEGKSVFSFGLPALFTHLWTCCSGSVNNNNDERHFLLRKVKSSVSQTSTYSTETKFKNKKQ